MFDPISKIWSESKIYFGIFTKDYLHFQCTEIQTFVNSLRLDSILFIILPRIRRSIKILFRKKLGFNKLRRWESEYETIRFFLIVWFVFFLIGPSVIVLEAKYRHRNTHFSFESIDLHRCLSFDPKSFYRVRKVLIRILAFRRGMTGKELSGNSCIYTKIKNCDDSQSIFSLSVEQICFKSLFERFLVIFGRSPYFHMF